jgi:hypothetical protein
MAGSEVIRSRCREQIPRFAPFLRQGKRDADLWPMVGWVDDAAISFLV